MRTTVYALRDRRSKIRTTYRYRSVRKLLESLLGPIPDDDEIYRTTMDLPRIYKAKRK